MTEDQLREFNKSLSEVCIKAIGIDPAEISLESVYELYLKRKNTQVKNFNEIFESIADELIISVRFYPRRVSVKQSRIEVYIGFEILGNQKKGQYYLCIYWSKNYSDQAKVCVGQKMFADSVDVDNIQITCKNRTAGWLLARL